MSSKISSAPYATVHPAVGTKIDNGALELVEVLGVGGYGVVYRAVDTRPPNPKSYAVKCLISQPQQTARQRQIHIREIALHQLASAHPGVVTLHRVLEESNLTYIVMDYAPDHDLFTQILHSCRYLGDDYLIKHVFMQLLDAVEYCHSLGIYHRDLKPENVLCFDDGLRVAITDFGLATTDKLSEEFRTGSVYHMSPECQGGDFAPTGNYSPMFNDIWSLGIILLNLATGRNPWKSATQDDPTFQAYLRDPFNFLPTVLPISPEINDILIRMLDVDWRQRMTLSELRFALEDVNSFYAEGVIFEGSMARCPWEEGMDIDDSDESTKGDSPESKSASPICDTTRSHWSKESTSDIIFANRSMAQESSYGVPWTDYSSSGATWAFESTISESFHQRRAHEEYDRSSTPYSVDSPPSPISPCDSINSSLPVTPNSRDLVFGDRSHPPEKKLTIDTNLGRPFFYNDHDTMESYSAGSSMMETAIDFDPYSPSFFATSPLSPKVPISVAKSGLTPGGFEDKEMASPSAWAMTNTHFSSPSRYSQSSSEASDLGGELSFNRSETPSPEWTGFRLQAESPPSYPSQPLPSMFTFMTDPLPPSRPSIFTLKKSTDGKSKTPSIFNSIKFFPRSSSPAPAPAPQKASDARGRRPSEPLPPFPHSQTIPPPTIQYWAGFSPSRATPEVQSSAQDRNSRRTVHLRSPRHWFIPGKLFGSAGAA